MDKQKRQAGILLAISSLPGEHGVGDLGKSAYQFIDIASKMGFSIWQILPLNPSGGGDSPYTPFSSFAGDELYISLDILHQWGLLDHIPALKETKEVDYDFVRKFKHVFLQLAFDKFKVQFKDYKEEYETFCRGAFWLEDYVQFMALHELNNGLPWNEWQDFQDDDQDYKDYLRFIQFIFIKQFQLIKIYAHRHHMLIMGDLPFYVGYDSSDVYHYQQCFMLDENHLPRYVSGASPDYFNQDGQLWNHPIYDWDYLKQTNYQYWIDKLKWNSELYDVIRLDHFRAIDTYWRVPYGDENARNGQWIEGPAYDFLDCVFERLPDLDMIVEDLGDLRDEVHHLRDHYHLMGMRVMEYSFGDKEEYENFVMPSHCVVYSGTHDNAPLQGWFDEELDQGTREHIEWILSRYDYPEKTVPMQILHRTFDCESMIAICTVQDLLQLNNQARLNYPGTQGKPNWCWKLENFEACQAKIKETKQLLKKTKRLK